MPYYHVNTNHINQLGIQSNKEQYMSIPVSGRVMYGQSRNHKAGEPFTGDSGTEQHDSEWITGEHRMPRRRGGEEKSWQTLRQAHHS